jgi:hypothetical protein
MARPLACGCSRGILIGSLRHEARACSSVVRQLDITRNGATSWPHHSRCPRMSFARARWMDTLYINNLTNQLGINSYCDLSNYGANYQAVVSTPRTGGMTEGLSVQSTVSFGIEDASSEFIRSKRTVWLSRRPGAVRFALRCHAGAGRRQWKAVRASEAALRQIAARHAALHLKRPASRDFQLQLTVAL